MTRYLVPAIMASTLLLSPVACPTSQAAPMGKKGNTDSIQPKKQKMQTGFTSQKKYKSTKKDLECTRREIEKETAVKDPMMMRFFEEVSRF